MPNGGNDCCGTCRYNEKNKDLEVGYRHFDEPGRNYCIIRGFPIADPFYTYCDNHPKHNPNKVLFPVGQVFRAKGDGRVPFLRAPDTPEIREGLLGMLADIASRSPAQGSIASLIDIEAIKQLADCEELRAVPLLERILEHDPVAVCLNKLKPEDSFWEKLKVSVDARALGTALEALAWLAGEAARPHIDRFRKLARANRNPEGAESAEILRDSAWKAKKIIAKRADREEIPTDPAVSPTDDTIIN
jgi:hypothetical protein